MSRLCFRQRRLLGTIKTKYISTTHIAAHHEEVSPAFKTLFCVWCVTCRQGRLFVLEAVARNIAQAINYAFIVFQRARSISVFAREL